MSPTTSGRNVERTCSLISSTAFSPAAMSTPASGVGERIVARRVVAASRPARHCGRVAEVSASGAAAASSSSTSLESARAGTGTGYSPERHAVQNDVGRRAGGAGEPVELEVGERVDLEEVADLADRQVGGEQLGAAAGVHAVEARPLVRRRRHPEVHLGRAGLAQHRDDLAGGGAAHDRVVDDDEPLARGCSRAAG